MTDLIVNDVRPRVQFEQTVGGVVSFDLPFPALAADHVKVSVDGGPVNAEPYSVENLGQTGGARIVFAAAPALGAKIAVWREAPVERLTDFADDGTFRAKALNQELDRITLLLQELEALTGDAVRKPPSDADLDLTLPDAASRANRFLSFDADGRPEAAAAVESIGFVQENLADIRNYADTYLGARATDPTTRNDGAPLQDGDLYFNTTFNRMRIHDQAGAAWIDAFAINSDYMLRNGSPPMTGPLDLGGQPVTNAQGFINGAGAVHHLGANNSTHSFFGGDGVSKGAGWSFYGGAHSAQPSAAYLSQNSTPRLHMTPGGGFIFYDGNTGTPGAVALHVHDNGFVQARHGVGFASVNDEDRLKAYKDVVSWTPTLLFGGAGVGITYTIRQGNATRIGQLVFLQMWVALSHKGSSAGVATVSSLPWSPASVMYQTLGIADVSGLASALGGALYAYVDGPSAQLALRYLPTGSSNYASLSSGNMTNTTQIVVSGCYLTEAA